MPDDIIASEPFSSPAIADGSLVTLHFSILLEDGREVDGTRRGKPASFVVGDGNLLPGFEAVLVGMRAGDDAQYVLPAEEAFGPHREENLQWMDRAQFTDVEPEPDLVVSFAHPSGELPGVVKKVTKNMVCVDFNHPLAGHALTFDVSVLAVKDGTPSTK